MICAYTGNLGTGKTYCMVARALGEVRHRRRIFSNMNVTWAENFTSWETLLELSNGLVLVDEAGGWFNAREWKDSPKEVFRWMTQSRKQGLSMWYTAQHMSQIDKNLRLLTNLEYRHERWWGNLIRERCFDAQSGDYLSTRWYKLSKKVFQAYDTLEVVGLGKGDANRRGRSHLHRVSDGLSDRPAAAVDDAFALAEAERCLVREADACGRVRYRQATGWDVVHGADLVPRIVVNETR